MYKYIYAYLYTHNYIHIMTHIQCMYIYIYPFSLSFLSIAFVKLLFLEISPATSPVARFEAPSVGWPHLLPPGWSTDV